MTATATSQRKTKFLLRKLTFDLPKLESAELLELYSPPNFTFIQPEHIYTHIYTTRGDFLDLYTSYEWKSFIFPPMTIVCTQIKLLHAFVFSAILDKL